jgi:hypothetical protein
MRWVGHAVCMGVVRNSYNILAGKPEEKTHLGRPGRRWEDNIKVEFKEMREDLDWI